MNSATSKSSSFSSSPSSLAPKINQIPTPPGLIGAALIVWGWQAGYMVPALVMGIVFEASHLLKFRWAFGPGDFHPIVVLCNMLVIIMLFYRYLSDASGMFQWIPMAVFPLLAAQAYSTTQGVYLNDLYWLDSKKRKRFPPSHPNHAPGVNPPPPGIININGYALIVILISTAAANNRTPNFYIAMTLLICWALWPSRPHHHRMITWAVFIMIAAGVGWAGQIGLRKAQNALESRGMDWYMRSNIDDDPFQSTTSIGQVGELKMSDRIIMRAMPESAMSDASLPNFEMAESTAPESSMGRSIMPKDVVKMPPPPLFSQAVYTTYRAAFRPGRWFAQNAAFSKLPPEQKMGGWVLPFHAENKHEPSTEDISHLNSKEFADTSPEINNGHVRPPDTTQYENPRTNEREVFHIKNIKSYKVRIDAFLNNGEGLLPLPTGAFRVEDLKKGILDGNSLGTIRIKKGPDRLRCSMMGSGDQFNSGPPGPDDLKLPGLHKELIASIADALNLRDFTPRQAIQTIAKYFQPFKYTLVQEKYKAGDTPLEVFLKKTRAGHCEYFATASVLLLRAANVPARYVTGFVVDEFSTLENCFVIRSRHAHAWAVAYQNGCWQVVDNTPSNWLEMENKQASHFQGLLDLYDWLTYRWGLWWESQSPEKQTQIVMGVLVMVLIFVMWRTKGFRRLSMKKEKREDNKKLPDETARDKIHPPSPFDRIEQVFAEKGMGKYEWETFGYWIGRIISTVRDETVEQELSLQQVRKKENGHNDKGKKGRKLNPSEFKSIMESGKDRLDAINSLNILLLYHNRLRFHPLGLNDTESKQFEENVNEWIQRFSDHL